VGLGKLQRAHEREPERGAIERAIVLLRERLLAALGALEVALLEAGLAVLVLLRALVGPARERERRRQQARPAERRAAIEVDARGAVLLGEDTLELVDRGLVRLVTGLRRPRL